MNTSNRYLVGIDTGGTYTDAVVLSRDAREIVATAKSITTKGDLSIGVSSALASVIQQSGIGSMSVDLVSISTTLATNAVVEGHGSAIAVVLIGFDDSMVARTGLQKAFPDMPVLRTAGGHNHNGEEAAKLDLAVLEKFCADHGPRVGAFAVASAFAVRNAAHEFAARSVIIEKTGKPVTLSSEITSALDAPRRALTAALNARLISKIAELITAVRKASTKLGLSCPLMIVRGDGTLGSTDLIAMRPIETVLSGPAASLVGARWLSGLNNFVMSDIGGTTTDIGAWLNGRPQVAAGGASVGGWRTMVQAIDVTTVGLGGDSEVHIGLNGEINLGPSRALPVSLLGDRNPELLAMLESDLAETEGGSLLGKFVVLPFGAATGSEQPIGREQDILSLVTTVPTPLRKIAANSATQRIVQSLRRKGLLQLCTFTPSDASHVLNKQTNWSRQAAVLAAKIVARFRSMKAPDDHLVESLCNEVLSRTVELSCRAILDVTTNQNLPESPLVDAVCKGTNQLGLAKISISPNVPVIAVGGPAKVFYGEVGRRLQCEVIYPHHWDVANAVGAAAGIVQYRAEVVIEGDGQGLFRVFAAGKTQNFNSGKTAVEVALAEAKKLALNGAIAAGGHNPRVDCRIDRNFLPDATDDEGLLSARVVAEASGLPTQ